MNTPRCLDGPAAGKLLRQAGSRVPESGPAIDRLCRLVGQLLQVPLAMVTLVEEKRLVFKGQFGLPEPWRSAGEAPRDFSICPRVVEARSPVIISDVESILQGDTRPELLRRGYVSYLGIPLVDVDGHASGSFCVLDRQPRSWRSGEIGVVSELAASVCGEILLCRRVRELRQMRELLARWLEQSPAACLSLSADLAVTSCNTEASRLFGWTGSQFGAAPLGQLLSGPKAEEGLLAFLREVSRTGRPGAFTADCLTAGGRRFPAEWRVTLAPALPVGSNGFIVTLIDLSARQQEAAARAELETRLRRAHELGMLDTLAGGVAHEFNNVLGTILGHVDLARSTMAQSAGQPVLAETVEQIGEVSVRARETVQNILRRARGEPARVLPVQLGPVIDETARLLRPTLPRHVQLEVICSSRIPAVVADATQIQQVLLNLVGNSVHAIGERPGRIELSLAAAVPPGIRAGKAALSETLRLRVRDNGCGMDEVTMVQIFKPFFTTKKDGQGTGLGLSIVREIVEAAGGRIDVSSEIEAGTTVDLFFPAAEEAQFPRARRTESVSAPAGLVTHVWLLDDDEAMVSMASRALRRLGHKVSGFTDAEAALEAFHRHPDEYGLALVDLNMPGQSGLDVVRQLRARYPELPLIVATGDCRPEVMEELQAEGVVHLLDKPMTIEEMACGIQCALAAASQEVSS